MKVFETDHALCSCESLLSRIVHDSLACGNISGIGAQALLLASRIVVDVIPAAIPATVKPEFLFHSCCFLSQR